MRNPIVLYSTNTKLAYSISQRYYNQKHYVWCIPNEIVFHGSAPSTLPPTSHPIKIFWSLVDSVSGNDKHCPKIEQNRIGLLGGAEKKLENGEISEEDYTEIVDIITQAGLGEFYPLFYVIPYDAVKDRIVRPTTSSKASVLSPEIQIYDLRSDEFDPLELTVARS